MDETRSLSEGRQAIAAKNCYKIKSVPTVTCTGGAPKPPWREEDGRLILNLRIDRTPLRLPHANQYTLPPSAPTYRRTSN